MGIRLFIAAAVLVWLLGVSACTGGGEPAATKPAPVAPSAPVGGTNPPAPSGPAATIKGRVKVTTKPPAPETIKMAADNVCVKQNAGKVVLRPDLVVGADLALANVVVYVKDGLNKGTGAGEEVLSPVVLDQQGCMYTPHVLAVRVNQKIQIKNSDPALHNVNASSKLGQGFNIGMPTQGQVSEKSFSKPELGLRLKCDVHGWMNAYVSVFDHPYFGVTDAAGGFSLPPLPAGTYTIEAWHEKLGTKSAQVVLSGKDETLELTF